LQEIFRAELAAPLGDEAAAAQTVEAALAQVMRTAEVAVAATGKPVMLQTLAGDADAPQINMDIALAGSSRHLASEFNRRLASQARQAGHLLLDVDGLSASVGQGTWSAGCYWYAAKYPFAVAMAPRYADHVMRLIAAQMGRSRRVLVLDLDNTLWGGIVGDDGIEGAANIKAIAGMIDLGLASFVFLDDNPAERKRVRVALPAVAVPELPDDPAEWISVFQAAG
jgi:predicted enzyme involved in methoxymalonyl-ACP biosynthesis